MRKSVKTEGRNKEKASVRHLTCLICFFNFVVSFCYIIRLQLKILGIILSTQQSFCYLLFLATNSYIYIYYNIKFYYKRLYMFRCLCAIFRELWYCVCWSYKILKFHKTVDRFMVKSVLLIKYGSDCICNMVVAAYAIW